MKKKTFVQGITICGENKWILYRFDPINNKRYNKREYYTVPKANNSKGRFIADIFSAKQFDSSEEAFELARYLDKPKQAKF